MAVSESGINGSELSRNERNETGISKSEINGRELSGKIIDNISPIYGIDHLKSTINNQTPVLVIFPNFA